MKKQIMTRAEKLDYENRMILLCFIKGLDSVTITEQGDGCRINLDNLSTEQIKSLHEKTTKLLDSQPKLIL